MFNSIIDSSTNIFTTNGIIISIISAIVLGLIISFVYIKTNRYTKNFAITLVLLPLLVEVAIMTVNGNLGTGVAVLGVFSLVRFRSIPGNSREIICVFFAMIVGLILGSGYIVLAIIVTVIVSLLLIILSKSNFANKSISNRSLKILIPEDLDYKEIFKPVFEKYLKGYELIRVKTTNMGSLFELTYNVDLKEDNEKLFIDDLRILNGNLKIILDREIDGEYL